MRLPNNRYHGVLLAALASAFFSCRQQPMPTSTISGQMPGYEKQTIRLLQVLPNQRERMLLDSATIGSNGSFAFRAIPLDSSLVQLDVNNGPSWLLFADGKNMETSLLKGGTPPDYSVSGSAGSAWIRSAYRRISLQEKQLATSRNQYLDFSRQSYPDSLQQLAAGRYRQDSTRLLLLCDSLLRTAPHLLLYRYAAAYATQQMPASRMDSLHAWASRRFADSSWLK